MCPLLQTVKRLKDINLIKIDNYERFYDDFYWC